MVHYLWYTTQSQPATHPQPTDSKPQLLFPEALSTPPLCNNRFAMRTEKQIAASRANGAKSRGPVSLEGKLNSSRNGLHHGILARTVVLDTESKDRFHELLHSFQDTYQPQTIRPRSENGRRRLASHAPLVPPEDRLRPRTPESIRRPRRRGHPHPRFRRISALSAANPSLPASWTATKRPMTASSPRALRLLHWEQAVRMRTQQVPETLRNPLGWNLRKSEKQTRKANFSATKTQGLSPKPGQSPVHHKHYLCKNYLA
jgi:hypothetical protein